MGAIRKSVVYDLYIPYIENKMLGDDEPKASPYRDWIKGAPTMGWDRGTAKYYIPTHLE